MHSYISSCFFLMVVSSHLEKLKNILWEHYANFQLIMQRNKSGNLKSIITIAQHEFTNLLVSFALHSLCSLNDFPLQLILTFASSAFFFFKPFCNFFLPWRSPLFFIIISGYKHRRYQNGSLCFYNDHSDLCLP